MTNNENFYQKYRQELVPRLVPGAAAADGAKVPNAEAVASVGGRVLSAEEIAAEAEMNAILASDDAPSTSFSNESDESSPNNSGSAEGVSAARTSRPKKNNKVAPAPEVPAG